MEYHSPPARERKSQAMKLTLIRMTAPLPMLLLGSQIVLAADQVPKLDIGRSCRSAGAAAVGGARDTAACERDENTAGDTLEKEWNQFTPAQRAECVRLSSLGGSPSYVELLTCLEIAKQTNEIPAGERMDSGDTIEKSRHAK